MSLFINSCIEKIDLLIDDIITYTDLNAPEVLKVNKRITITAFKPPLKDGTQYQINFTDYPTTGKQFRYKTKEIFKIQLAKLLII